MNKPSLVSAPRSDWTLFFVDFLNSRLGLHEMTFSPLFKDVKEVCNQLFRLEMVALMWIFSK